MSRSFYDSIYNATLRAKMREGRISEMAKVNAHKLDDLLAKKYPDVDIATLYRDPDRLVRGTNAYNKYHAIIDDYAATYPEDRDVGSKKTFGAAMADTVFPRAYKGGKGNDNWKKEIPVSEKVESIISLIKKAQNELDMAGFGDSEAANKLMNLLPSLDALKSTSPASAIASSNTDDTDDSVAEEEVAPDVDFDSSSTDDGTSDDPFGDVEDDKFAGATEDDINKMLGGAL